MILYLVLKCNKNTLETLDSCMQADDIIVSSCDLPYKKTLVLEKNITYAECVELFLKADKCITLN